VCLKFALLETSGRDVSPSLFSWCGTRSYGEVIFVKATLSMLGAKEKELRSAIV
jgi:hypothetical protein